MNLRWIQVIKELDKLIHLSVGKRSKILDSIYNNPNSY